MSKKFINKLFNNYLIKKTYIVIPRNAFWLITVQASKVIEKVLLKLIFSNNSVFISSLLLLNYKLSSSIRTWEYKGGISLFIY